MATDVGLADLPAVPFAAVRFDVAAALLFAAALASGADFRPGLGTTMSTCSSAVRSLSEPITRFSSPASGTSRAASPPFCWVSSPS